MNLDQTISELVLLPVSERLRIVQAIWNTLPFDADLGVSEEQQSELDQRRHADRVAPSTAISHDELMRRVEKRL